MKKKVIKYVKKTKGSANFRHLQTEEEMNQFRVDVSEYKHMLRALNLKDFVNTRDYYDEVDFEPKLISEKKNEMMMEEEPEELASPSSSSESVSSDE